MNTRRTDDIPRFAIVGHPNKGKSSLVATLSHDQDVAISPLSGTTEVAQEFPLIVDGNMLYVLVDTPGFQRSRAVYEWISSHSKSAGDRRAAVEQFVAEHRNDERFKSECELLAPLIEGAGILYVVDGSVPYGSEYDAEMEILRWTGNPSMALINQIGDSDFIQEWEQALTQYFKIVRTFNAKTAEFDKQLNLLNGFAELNEKWKSDLNQAITALRKHREYKRTQAAQLISANLISILTLKEEYPGNEISDSQKSQFLEDYKTKIMEMEKSNRNEIEWLYGFDHLEREDTQLLFESNSLFSQQSWQIFGLSKDQLVAVGAVGGAAAGSLVDIATGGGSLLLGSGIGAIAGGLSAWLGGDNLAKTELTGNTIGTPVYSIGPIQNINLPFILLGRALLHLWHMEVRTHAQRNKVALSSEELEAMQSYTTKIKELAVTFARIRRSPDSIEKHAAALTKQVLQIIKSENFLSRELDQNN